MQAEIILPIIHMNGTSPETLREGYVAAMSACNAALDIALKILWAHRDKFPGCHGNTMELYLSLPFGKAVCVVQKTGCVQTRGNEQSFLTHQEFTLGDYSPGRFAYPTTNLRVLKTPVPVRGRQSLFDLSPEEEKAVRAQLENT